MSEIYEDEGWEVVVSTPSSSDGKFVLEHYAIALKDQSLARRKIEEFRGAGAKVAGIIPLTACVMRGYALLPGRWMEMFVDRRTE
jgi:hypothetical protein